MAAPEIPSAMRRPSLPNPCVFVVTDRRRTRARPIEEVVDRAIQGGASVVIQRERDLPSGEMLLLARRLRGVCAGRCLFLVADRPDVAILSGADGVHLPEEGLPAAAVRQWLPHGMLLGRSVHSLNAARQAESDGVDYLVLGTVFPSESHPERDPVGPELVQSVTSRVAIPVIAIGGITPENVGRCRAAGAQGVAAITGILQATDPTAIVRDLFAGLGPRCG